jgi:hypothetical protein
LQDGLDLGQPDSRLVVCSAAPGRFGGSGVNLFGRPAPLRITDLVTIVAIGTVSPAPLGVYAENMTPTAALEAEERRGLAAEHAYPAAR